MLSVWCHRRSVGCSLFSRGNIYTSFPLLQDIPNYVIVCWKKSLSSNLITTVLFAYKRLSKRTKWWGVTMSKWIFHRFCYLTYSKGWFSNLSWFFNDLYHICSLVHLSLTKPACSSGSCHSRKYVPSWRNIFTMTLLKCVIMLIVANSSIVITFLTWSFLILRLCEMLKACFTYWPAWDVEDQMSFLLLGGLLWFSFLKIFRSSSGKFARSLLFPWPQGVFPVIILSFSFLCNGMKVCAPVIRPFICLPYVLTYFS